MTLAFRNLDLTPDAPVESWPVEAILTAIERGDLSHWHRLAAAAADDPWGPVARRTEEALELSEAYGITPALRRVLADARLEAERAERERVSDRVQALVERSGLSGAEFASRIGTSASRFSTYRTGKVTPSAALMLRMERVAGSSPGHETAEGPALRGPRKDGETGT